jgi:hypothetical protein
MSFLNDIIDLGSSVVNFVTGPGVGSQIAQTALTGYLVSQLNSSVTPENKTATDTATSEPTTNTNKEYGTREQVDPDTSNSIPVVYGDAFIGGKIVDAVLSDNQQLMYYCLVLSEHTGTKMSDNQDSIYQIKNIYWNQLRMVFKNNGYVFDKFVSEDGVIDADASGYIAVYPFAGGSTFPIGINNYSAKSTQPAWEIFPGWTEQHTMDDLVFVIIGVQYNKAAGITGLGKMQFHLSNSMKLPGDCIFDYMTNTRYGAGIPPEEINS